MCLHPGGSPRGAGGLLLLMKKTALGEGLPGSQRPPCSAAPGCSSGNRTRVQGEWAPDGEAGTWMGSPCPSGPHLLLWGCPLLLGAGWSRPGCGLTRVGPSPSPSPLLCILPPTSQTLPGASRSLRSTCTQPSPSALGTRAQPRLGNCHCSDVANGELVMIQKNACLRSSLAIRETSRVARGMLECNIKDSWF